MEQHELADIIKRRAGWRLYLPWGLRNDIDMLIVAAIGSQEPSCPVPVQQDESLKTVKTELEKLKKDKDALVKWIMVTFGLNNVPSTGEVIDLLAKSIVARKTQQ